MVGLWVALALVAAATLTYWLFIVTEGTYLGAKVVTLLYDWTASRYDEVKNLQYVNELRYLGMPLVASLRKLRRPHVLDVATGTGRVPLLLLGLAEFTGMVVGVDRSLRMMAQAKAAVVQYGTRVALIHEDAEALSFRGEAFDLVTCLEALEFMWDPAAVLREMVRVLRPGGVLLVSGRVGRDARFFPGRLCPPGRVVACLHELGMDAITTERWQVHYDLIWARKPLGSP